MIKHIKASNILSFGPDGLDLELKPLNVLIGANGSGKSNFLELIDLMRNMPNDMANVFRKNGGTSEWRWKGSSSSGFATSDISIIHKMPFGDDLSHEVALLFQKDEFVFYREKIGWINSEDIKETQSTFYENLGRKYKLRRGSEIVEIQNIDQSSSILYQIKDPVNYGELDLLSDFYANIQIYRDWVFGRSTIFRRPQPSDSRNDRLEPDFSNIGLFLNKLRRDPKTKRELIKHLQYLYDGISDFEVNIVEGGYVQILFTEGDFSIPASRLSDGTLRYLCLLAILLDPNPPALICIEEPELGLHPDILPHLTDLLVEASERTQLIITTHSDVIVDALTDHPESILVCEKHAGQTSIRRLDSENIKLWLEDYRLGELWSRGQIGGNRW
jgi:predicted ATPase